MRVTVAVVSDHRSSWLELRRPVWPLVAGGIVGMFLWGGLRWIAGPDAALVVDVLALVTVVAALVVWSRLVVRAGADGVFVRNWFGSRMVRWDEIVLFDATARASFSFRPFGVSQVVLHTTGSRPLRLAATTGVHAWASERNARERWPTLDRLETLRRGVAQVDVAVRMASAEPGRCWSCWTPMAADDSFCPSCGRNAAHPPVAR